MYNIVHGLGKQTPIVDLGLSGFLDGEGVKVVNVECTTPIQVDTYGEILKNGQIVQYPVEGNFQSYPFPQPDGSCHTLAGVPHYFRPEDIDAFHLNGLPAKGFIVVRPDGSIRTEDIVVNEEGAPLGHPIFPVDGFNPNKESK